jgi:ABC-type multidrug transport system fused ATPase/permease subunit
VARAESAGVARRRDPVARLRRRAAAFHDTNRVGAILSTLTGDVQTIQSFASVSTLNIFTGAIRLVGMIVVMFLLRWIFALITLR